MIKILEDVLDIGTTEDVENPSSNYIVRNLKDFEFINLFLIKNKFKFF